MLLGISPALVRQHVRSGVLPGVQLGGRKGRYKLSLAALRAYIARTDTPRPKPWS